MGIREEKKININAGYETNIGVDKTNTEVNKTYTREAIAGAADGEQQKLQKQIDEFIKGLGGSFAGFSNVGETLPDSLRKYPYAITFGIRLSDAIIDEIDDKPTYTYFNHYRSVNALIDQIGLRIMLFIQDTGYKAYTIPASQSISDAPVPYSAIFPHKTGAVASGMGWIGKNGLFIHKNYGPRVRLGTVLTDMELVRPGKLETAPNGLDISELMTDFAGNVDPACASESGISGQAEQHIVYHNKVLETKCGTCNKCVQACPAMALTGKTWHIGVKRDEIVDAKACSEYMNKKFKHIGRGSVCGICVKVCPFSSI